MVGAFVQLRHRDDANNEPLLTEVREQRRPDWPTAKNRVYYEGRVENGPTSAIGCAGGRGGLVG